MTALWVALAGGVGAVLRLLLDGAIRARTGEGLPLGTAAINLSGSFVLGVVVGLSAHSVLAEPVHLVVGTGLLGGYTTFSTASFETVRLYTDRRWGAALANGLGMLVAGVACAGGGIWLGLAAGH